MSATTKMIVDELYQDRLETLLSVDDLVEEVVGTLEVGGAHCSQYNCHTVYSLQKYWITPTFSTTVITVSRYPDIFTETITTFCH